MFLPAIPVHHRIELLSKPIKKEIPLSKPGFQALSGLSLSSKEKSYGYLCKPEPSACRRHIQGAQQIHRQMQDLSLSKAQHPAGNVHIT